MNLKVSEHFYSLQGEGKTAGIPAYFLRLADCNLLCGGKGTIKDKKLHDGATWRCDTIEVWRTGTRHRYHEILEYMGEPGIVLQKLATRKAHLVITGGEPLLQLIQVTEFVEFVMHETENKAIIEIETNGTILPSHKLLSMVSYWNVSPKLANSGMSERLRYFPNTLEAINTYGKDVIFKFVVSDPANDLEEIINEYYLPCRMHASQVYLMPGASDIETYNRLLPVIADVCKDTCFRLGTRLQIDIWNQTTGV